MVSIAQHNVELTIKHEMPENSLSISLNIGFGDEVTLYLRDLEQWWSLRNAVPKDAKYWLGRNGHEGLRGDDADAWAYDFYEREKAKRQPISESAPTEASPDEEEIVF